jgi:hypothetical protein
MKRSRVLLLGAMVALLSLAGLGRARGTTIQCYANCEAQYNTCTSTCDGNTICLRACSNQESGCVRFCGEL